MRRRLLKWSWSAVHLDAARERDRDRAGDAAFGALARFSSCARWDQLWQFLAAAAALWQVSAQACCMPHAAQKVGIMYGPKSRLPACLLPAFLMYNIYYVRWHSSRNSSISIAYYDRDQLQLQLQLHLQLQLPLGLVFVSVSFATSSFCFFFFRFSLLFACCFLFSFCCICFPLQRQQLSRHFSR